jgi:hypothetical protein
MPRKESGSSGLADNEAGNLPSWPRRAETCAPHGPVCAPQGQGLGGSAASSYDGPCPPAGPVASPRRRSRPVKAGQGAAGDLSASHSDDSSGGMVKGGAIDLRRITPQSPTAPAPRDCNASDSDVTSDIDIGGDVYHEPSHTRVDNVGGDDRCPTPTSAPLPFTCLFRQPGSRACSPDWPAECEPQPLQLDFQHGKSVELFAAEPNSGSWPQARPGGLARPGGAQGVTRMGSSNGRGTKGAGLLDEAYQGDVGAVAGVLARRVAHLPAKALFQFVQELNEHLAGGLAV